jgi:hypothetical protein
MFEQAYRNLSLILSVHGFHMEVNNLESYINLKISFNNEMIGKIIIRGISREGLYSGSVCSYIFPLRTSESHESFSDLNEKEIVKTLISLRKKALQEESRKFLEMSTIADFLLDSLDESNCEKTESVSPESDVYFMIDAALTTRKSFEAFYKSFSEHLGNYEISQKIVLGLGNSYYLEQNHFEELAEILHRDAFRTLLKKNCRRLEYCNSFGKFLSPEDMEQCKFLNFRAGTSKANLAKIQELSEITTSNFKFLPNLKKATTLFVSKGKDSLLELLNQRYEIEVYRCSDEKTLLGILNRYKDGILSPKVIQTQAPRSYVLGHPYSYYCNFTKKP